MRHHRVPLPGLAGLRKLLAARDDGRPEDIELTAGRMRGGLMADLLRVSAARAGARPELFVVKRVGESGGRETAAYEALAACGLTHLAPRLLGTSADEGSRFLFLEYVARWRSWPWRSETHAGMVLDLLAELHAAPIRQHGALRSADEEHLQRAGLYTLDLLGSAGRQLREPRLLRHGATLRTLVRELRRARQLALADAVFLHGDVHPGNVLVRAEGGRHRAVLLDWGRARMGSRFEDVASWLQCLRYFEPSAVAAHDRLLLRYVRRADLGDRITPAHRRQYWVAAGCNALAGALAVHLAAALGATTPDARQQSIAAALDWLRIARRALAYLDAN